MADISYTRTFTHTDWVDGQSVVQAGGLDGFNGRFHSYEGELDKISTTFGMVNTAIKNVQTMKFVNSHGGVSLNPGTFQEFDVETYDKSTWPDPNLDKVYFCLLIPTASPSPPIVQAFHYHPQGTTMRVTLVLHNPQAGAVANFAYRILALGGVS